MLLDATSHDHVFHIFQVTRQKMSNIFLNGREIVAGGIVMRRSLVTRDDNVIQGP
jgi:hypothetical protein